MGWAPEGDPWLNDTEHLWPADGVTRAGGGARAWLRVDAASGASSRSTRPSSGVARSSRPA